MHRELPEGQYGDTGPIWIGRIVKNKPARPMIRCKCGGYRGLANHHIFQDGIVTPAFECDCGWRGWIKLRDYFYGNFDPDLPNFI